MLAHVDMFTDMTGLILTPATRRIHWQILTPATGRIHWQIPVACQWVVIILAITYR
ncbi:hypothetical protein SLEP1_g41026 [Rubroshorea leprosula]|uniref:Uncharacterized protein n=1 Tax=Rubroshorea leprosula TaxID=152421 RepID=A0AAV5L5U4_9ROSI|nr:hypothetical protein SLEP1_g41026 [Rubroshorea leprosula]